MQNAWVKDDLRYCKDSHCSESIGVTVLHELKTNGVDQIYGKVSHEAHDSHIREGDPKRPEEIRLAASDSQEVLLPEQENSKETLQEYLIRDIKEFSIISR